MGKHKKIALILLGALVGLALLVLVGRNVIITLSVSPAVRSLTGFDAEVGHVNAGVFSSRISILALKVFNPSDFAEKRMLDAPEIHIEYKLFTMMSKRREFPVIRVRVAEVVVVKNERGESNVARIMASTPKSGSSGGKKLGAENHFGQLDLSLGKVILVDYSKMVGGKPLTKETTLNFHGTYHDLSDADLKKVVMWETLKFLPSKLGDITPDAIQKELGTVASGALGIGTNVTSAAAEAVKGLGGLFHSKTNAPSKTR